MKKRQLKKKLKQTEAELKAVRDLIDKAFDRAIRNLI
jgi:hypothetical protein